MRRFAIAVAVFLIGAATARPQSADQSPQAAASDRGAREKPAAQIQESADAPLSLSVQTEWATPDREMLEVYFTVKNVGSRPVRAYAVRVARGVETQEGAAVSSTTSRRRRKSYSLISRSEEAPSDPCRRLTARPQSS